MTNDYRLLWEKYARKPFTARSMTVPSRRILGMWESTHMNWDPGDVARFLRIKKLLGKQYLRALDRSVHPVVMRVVKWGLPLEAAVYVNPEWNIKCKYCHSTLISVPCNACLIKAGRHDDTLKDPEERFPLQLKEPKPVLHRPGSRDKFKEICERASRGEKVYSQFDAKANLR